MAGSIAKVFKHRFDGWFNLLSGVGIQGKDKRVTQQLEHLRLSETDVENFYASDDLFSKIVDLLPEDALREWIEIKGMDQAVESLLEKKLDSLAARQRLEEGWKWGRLYGGSGIYITVDDGLDPQEPVDESRIFDVKSMTTLSRYELIPYQINSNLDSPFFGHPEIYRLQTSQPTDFVERYIHHSRIIRFDGVPLPRRLKIQNQWWGDSVFVKCYNAVQNYNATHDAAVSALQDFSVGVFQIKGLADLISSGREDLVRTRLELVNLSKSVIKSIVLDTDEKFEHQSKSLSGVPEVMKQANSRLVVASGMPHTKILGESPSGLGADGKSEERNWYDYVKNQQKLTLRPRLDMLLRYIMLSQKGPTGGKIPEKWSYEFNPLWQMSDQEVATARFTQAQTDAIYLTNQVVDPDEIAHSRFGGDKYSMDTVIDTTMRRPTIDPLTPEANEQGGSKPEVEDPPSVSPAEEETPQAGSKTPDPGFVSRSDGKPVRKLQAMEVNGKLQRVRDSAGMSGFKKLKAPVEGLNLVYGNVEKDPTTDALSPDADPDDRDEFEDHNKNMQALWNWEEAPECGPDGTECAEPQS